MQIDVVAGWKVSFAALITNGWTKTFQRRRLHSDHRRIPIGEERMGRLAGVKADELD